MSLFQYRKFEREGHSLFKWDLTQYPWTYLGCISCLCHTFHASLYYLFETRHRVVLRLDSVVPFSVTVSFYVSFRYDTSSYSNLTRRQILLMLHGSYFNVCINHVRCDTLITCAWISGRNILYYLVHISFLEWIMWDCETVPGLGSRSYPW